MNTFAKWTQNMLGAGFSPAEIDHLFNQISDRASSHANGRSLMDIADEVLSKKQTGLSFQDVCVWLSKLS